MVTQSDHFITHMKLRELREQRTKLLQAYDELQQQLAQEPSEVGRLRLLYTGLRQIKLSHHPLHPDIANLEPLLHDTPSDPAALETVSFWRTRLAQELANGQLRSEIVYIFGALLEEWTHYNTALPSAGPENSEMRRTLMTPIMQDTNVTIDTTVLDPLFLAIQSVDAHFETVMQQILTENDDPLVKPDELHHVLEFIRTDEDRLPSIRQQAQKFLNDPIMLKEFADALTIMLTHSDEWDWPQEGISSHIVQTHNKWRLFIDEDLATTCFLEIVGSRWQRIFEHFFDALDKQLRQKMQYLLNSDTEKTLYNDFVSQYDMLVADMDLYTEVDIWSETGKKFSLHEPRMMQYNSISSHRAHIKQKLHQINRSAGYGVRTQKTTPDAMDAALQAIHAEITLGRVAFPDQPLHVIKVDLQDYYPSLAHKLLLTILERYGVPEKQRLFFRTFLQIPLQYAGQTGRVQRGIPNSRCLSDLLGEQVLHALDYYVRDVAHVQIIRLFDDICILTPSAAEALKAWQAIQRFCAGTGLSINAEKCGAICINGERLPELPAAQPGWLMLTLDPDGQWNVNMAAFTQYVQQAREEMKRIPALLSQIEAYNNHLQYLIKVLALQLPLGQRHRDTANNLLHSLHQTLFGERQGAVQTLRQLIRERFLGQANSIHIPEAWFYWPITAGGAGLYQVHILTSGYNERLAKQIPPTIPDSRPPDWQDQSVAWGSFYSALFYELDVRKPDSNQVMETLVTDFIQRGASLSAGTQTSLAIYWRWILYLYGPQIILHLGTFRFLITELVPLQLIMKRYQQTDVDTLAESVSSFSSLSELDNYPVRLDTFDEHPF